MIGRMRCLATVVLVLLLSALPAVAQQDDAPMQVVSANPFGLLLELFNAEYERRVGDSFGIGIGGSYATFDDDVTGEEESYFNMDVFGRFYPSGTVFDGWNFGAKVGMTSLPSGSYPGFGFDANRNWLLGSRNNFYVSLGFGLKRLIGDVGEDEPELIPTFRVVNIGFAF